MSWAPRVKPVTPEKNLTKVCIGVMKTGLFSFSVRLSKLFAKLVVYVFRPTLMAGILCFFNLSHQFSDPIGPSFSQYLFFPWMMEAVRWKISHLLGPHSTYSDPQDLISLLYCLFFFQLSLLISNIVI